MRVGYARVSTGEQNLDLQTDELKEAGCDKVLTDRISGAKAERPGLRKAMEYLRDGDVLVVWKLDRLGRPLKDLIGKVEALAEFERDIIRERTMAGLRAAKARGKTGGRPRALSEEDIALAQKLIVDPDLPVGRICEMLGVSSATLYRYVSPEGERRR